MAYIIRALLLKKLSATRATKCRPDLKLIDLGQNIWLSPMTNEVVKSFDLIEQVLEIGDDGEWDGYTVGVSKFLGEVSDHDDCAFIGAEFHGGSGTQWAALYSRLSGAPSILVGQDAINQALRMLGVSARSPRDEFDTVELRQFRSTDGWIASDDDC